MASNKNEISELSGYIKELIGEMRQLRGAMSNNTSKTVGTSGDSGKSSKSDKDKDGNGVEETIASIFQSITGIGGGIKKFIANTMYEFGKPWGIADDAASKYAKTIGGSAKTMAKMREDTIKFVSSNSAITAGFNTSMAELVDLQIAYNKEIGRTIRMSHEQLENIAAMKAMMGSDNAVKFAASFERFGLDVKAASKASAELFNDATRKGIVFEQLSNNFLNNIDLAQRYTFKGGIDGLRKMAEHSTSIRWDMQQTASFAEKVNNVEGAIKTGAQLSVLGGPFAQFSNPMGMLYQSLNDMEGLNERVTKIFQNFGKWNSETNQVEVSAFNRMRIRAAAEAMGLDYGKTMDSIYAQGRKQHILSKMSGMSVDESIKEYASNVGQINRETGEAFITINGKEKNVNELTNADKTEIEKLQQTEGEDIKEIAKSLRSYTDNFDGFTKHMEAKSAELLEQFNIGITIKNITQWFAENGALLRSLVLMGVAGAAGGKLIGWGNSLTKSARGWYTPPQTMSSPQTGGVYALGGAGSMGGATGSMGGTTGSMGGTTGSMGGMMMGGMMAGAPVLPNGTELTPKAQAKLNKLQKNLDKRFQRWVKKNPNATVGQINKALQNNQRIYNKALMKAETQAATQAKPNQPKNTPNNSKLRNGLSKGGQFLGRGLGAVGQGMMGYAMGDMIVSAAFPEEYQSSPGASALKGGLTGAAMGAAFPPFGPIIGGAIGTIGGLIFGFIDKSNEEAEKKRKEEEEAEKKRIEEETRNHIRANIGELYENYGVSLKGQYSPDELELIRGGKLAVGSGSKLHKKMIEQGDGDVFNSLKLAKGGLIVGRTHSQGGVNIGGGIEAEGGEFITNVASTKKHLGLLNAINQDELDSYIKSSQTKVLSNDIVASNNFKQDVYFSPLNANVSGTIKLDLGGYTKDIDGRQLLDNPLFTHYLTDVVTKQINLVDNKRFNKSVYFRKL